MKKLLAITFLFSATSFGTFAQNSLNSSAPAQMPSMSSILKDLESGIKSDAFLSSFKSADWAKKVSSLTSTDITGASKLLGELGAGLKPSSLVTGFNMPGWTSKLKSATTISSLASQAEVLTKAINPSMFKSGFDVSKITSSLDVLKTAK